MDTLYPAGFFVCGRMGRFIPAMNHIAPLLMFIGFVCAQDITIAVLDFDGKGVSQSEEVLIEIMQDQEPEVAIESIKGDCYNDGHDSGNLVNRYGALFAGFVGGYMGGPIGWFIVHSIVNASNPQPPDLEINALDGDCKNEYKKGFKNAVKDTKKDSVLEGCLIGYLLLLKSMN